MPLITHPLPFRALQLALALLYLNLLGYSTTHIGYWTHTALASALGITTALLTTLLLTHHIYRLLRLLHTTRITTNNNNNNNNTTTPTTTGTTISLAPTAPTKPPLLTTTATVAIEILFLLLWAGVTASMLMPKGKDFRVLFEEPPRVAWGVGVAVAAVEMVGFGLSTVEAVREGKTGGRAVIGLRWW